MSHVFVGDSVVIRDNFGSGRVGHNYVRSIPGGISSILCEVDIQSDSLGRVQVRLSSPSGESYTLISPGSGTASGVHRILTFPTPTPQDAASPAMSSWVGRDPIGLWSLEVVDSIDDSKYWDGVCHWLLRFEG